MNSAWKAGVASAVITPAEPMWLAGWAARNEPARGTLTDLYAKALALEDARGKRLVLVTLDLIAVSRELASAVAAELRERWHLPRERVLFCASHTHCGPEIRPDKVPFFHIPPAYAAKIPVYVSWLTDRLVALVGEALEDLQPARLRACRASAPFAHNRRGSALVDHEVPVLAVMSPDGRRRAVVFGYACHNLTLAPDDCRYCGDYAGFAQADLERDGGTALFIAGAGADLDPDPRGTVELARQHGQTLAAAVQQCLAASEEGPEIGGTLRVAYDEITLAFQPLPTRETLEADRASGDVPRRTKAEYLLARFDAGQSFPTSYPCPLQVVQLDDKVWLIALGGEPVIDFAHELKRRYANGGRLVWVAGYANDMFGYVPTARVLREGGYEGNRSVLWSALPAPFAEDAERRILDGVDSLLQSMR